MKEKKSKHIVLKSISSNWTSVLIVVIALVLTSLLSLVSPIIYKVLIDDVIPNKDQKGLITYLILMIAIPWLITLIASIKNYFSTKIGENISSMLLFNCGQCDSDIDKLLKTVSLKDFIMQLPDGISTDVGYNGELLSGGERQRIAIANALIRDSDVILLDEFTSALDLETERKVMNYIFSLKDKIIIIISHRIYALMNCDKIYVIFDGKIIEQGKPTELSKNKESYFTKMLNDLNYS